MIPVASSVYLRVSEKIEIPIIRITSIGIRILPIFSIPLSTPPSTTPAVAAMNTKSQIIGSLLPEIKLLK